MPVVAGRAKPLVVKPRLRGVTHQWAFFVSVALGPPLVLTVPSGLATAAATIYAGCVAVLFGSSALYHRVNWRSAGSRRWMRRLDHSAIFLLIAPCSSSSGSTLRSGWSR